MRKDLGVTEEEEGYKTVINYKTAYNHIVSCSVFNKSNQSLRQQPLLTHVLFQGAIGRLVLRGQMIDSVQRTITLQDIDVITKHEVGGRTYMIIIRHLNDRTARARERERDIERRRERKIKKTYCASRQTCTISEDSSALMPVPPTSSYDAASPLNRQAGPPPVL